MIYTSRDEFDLQSNHDTRWINVCTNMQVQYKNKYKLSRREIESTVEVHELKTYNIDRVRASRKREFIRLHNNCARLRATRCFFREQIVENCFGILFEI